MIELHKVASAREDFNNNVCASFSWAVLYSLSRSPNSLDCELIINRWSSNFSKGDFSFF